MLNQTGNLKKPTDIIVFTDSFSYSATCIFIKALQDEGGAIIVGYNGNPKLGNEVFDASQSPAPVMDFSFTEEYANLKKLGIQVGGITFGETFDEDYKKPNPIPREYKVDLIDERSDILNPYTDDDYDIFMSEANRVFRKYNEENQCNPNNKFLVFESNDCSVFEDDEHAHGGYPCGSNGEWNQSACQKFYCDFGYYYSKIEDKCIQDFCTNDPYIKEITLTDEYNETIVINEANNYEYVLTINTSEYIYFFEASEPGYMHYSIYDPCPNPICVLQMNQLNHNNEIHLNYFRSPGDKEITIKITSIKDFNGGIESMYASRDVTDLLTTFPPRFIFIAQMATDYIFYFKTFEADSRKLCAEYNENMTISDILNINESHFKEFGDEIIEAPEGKIYIFAYLILFIHNI